MRIVFMGTPSFAACILEHLCKADQVVGVFSAPDAVRGRGSKLVPSPVKLVAEQYEIPVYAATSFKDDDTFAILCDLKPDVICVAAFGVILPQRVLDLPKYGCLNVHASLLPRWRGAAPIERAILADDAQAGVSIMRMETGLDTGDYCNQVLIPLESQDADELTMALAQAGACGLVDVLHDLESSGVEWMAQDDTQATYAAKIDKHELNVRLSDGVKGASRKSRAASEAHPCKIQVNGKGLTLGAAFPFEEELDVELQPGQVLLYQKKLLLGFVDGWLQLGMVKPDGKAMMDGSQYANGLNGVKCGDVHWSCVGEE